ncbi:uncharacterized protein TNCV_2849771 [Trichonephila clavipes]|nr:uncharacterized protein TNCV_2849771 [Trichonephila clavipes]
MAPNVGPKTYYPVEAETATVIKRRSRKMKNLTGSVNLTVPEEITGWFNDLKIDPFDGLKNLMICDQMKKRCSPECKEHYWISGKNLSPPEMLADKLEAFDNIRRSLPSGPRRHVKASETVNYGRKISFRNLNASQKRIFPSGTK